VTVTGVACFEIQEDFLSGVALPGATQRGLAIRLHLSLPPLAVRPSIGKVCAEHVVKPVFFADQSGPSP